MVPPLQRHRPKFAERNTFVHALLGLVSYCGQLSRAAAVAEPRREPAPGPHRPEIELLLGVLSMGETLKRIVGEWAAEDLVRAVPPESAGVDASPRALLR